MFSPLPIIYCNKKLPLFNAMRFSKQFTQKHINKCNIRLHGYISRIVIAFITFKHMSYMQGDKYLDILKQKCLGFLVY